MLNAETSNVCIDEITDIISFGYAYNILRNKKTEFDAFKKRKTFLIANFNIFRAETNNTITLPMH